MLVKYNSRLKIVNASDNSEMCSDEIRDKVNEIIDALKSIKLVPSDVIFIEVERSVSTILTIIACIELQLAFTFCDSHKELYGHQQSKFRTTLIFNGREIVRIAENETIENDYDDPDEKICYVINTSGTSGKTKKQVAVPVFCIRKNIEHFCSIFDITSSDIVLFSTSLLFDPSIVELFMAFHVGCTLVLTPDNFRSEPHKMQSTIEIYRPTVAQFTSTVFEMLPSPDSLLSSTSSLRILLLGGSHFPLTFINSIRSSNNTTRIFNVYGVTEVSCWATSFEVEIGCTEILIRSAIDGTILEMDSDEQLILSGPRQCYVNGYKAEKHATGDRVTLTEDGGFKIIGRMDRVIKHKGIRVCLDNLTELALKEDSSIQSTHFIYYNNRNIIQFKSGPTSSSTDGSAFTRTLKWNETVSLIVTVIPLSIMPINSSGKVDEIELRIIAKEYFKSIRKNVKKFQDIVEKRLKIELPKVLDQTFVSIGINSLIAAELSAFFEGEQDAVLRKMLDDKTKIGELIDALGYFELNKKSVESGITEVHVETKRQPKMSWAVDLHKCIDGNILIISKSLVVCASHSGIVVAVNPFNGECIWRTNCGVRIESTPILVNDEIVIGGKNQGICFIDVKTGQLNSIEKYEEGYGIRSKCSFDGEFIYFTTENGYFHAIDPNNRHSVFRQCIEKNRGGTSVGPVIAPDGSIFATSTSGYFSKISKKPTFHRSFQKQFGPMFAEPIFLDSTSMLVTSVHAVLTILNIETGEFKDSLSLDKENCFCAPLIIRDKLLLATQSGKCFLIATEPSLQFLKVFHFDLPGISFLKPPKLLSSHQSFHKLMWISKNGWIIFGKLHDLDIFEEMVAFSISNKEVFTSPEVIEYMDSKKKLILVAGRDDYLRAWNFDSTE